VAPGRSRPQHAHHCSKPSTVHDSIKTPEGHHVARCPSAVYQTIDQRSIYHVKDQTAPPSASTSISASIVYVVQLLCR
jgi:hypothetical protein